MNDIRKGVTVALDGQPYVVVTSSFMRKQKSRPVMRATLKHLQTGQSKEHTFMQSDKIEEADVNRSQYQFLYVDGDSFQFMDQSTYEQVGFDRGVISDVAPFLLEGQIVDVSLYEGHPVAVQLPIKIDRKVIEAPPGVKGNTSTNVMKEVVIEGGTKMKAPLFIKVGDSIRIDTRTGEYIERA